MWSMRGKEALKRRWVLEAKGELEGCIWMGNNVGWIDGGCQPINFALEETFSFLFLKKELLF